MFNLHTNKNLKNINSLKILYFSPGISQRRLRNRAHRERSNTQNAQDLTPNDEPQTPINGSHVQKQSEATSKEKEETAEK